MAKPDKTKAFVRSLQHSKPTFGGGLGGTKFVNDANTLLHELEPHNMGGFQQRWRLLGASLLPDFYRLRSRTS